MFDLAYVGSKSDDLLRQVQINAVPRGATFLPQNQDPTRAPNTLAGANALPTDLLRPFPGYGAIRIGIQRLLELPRAADGREPPVRRRVDVLVLLRVEQGLGINNDDFSAGLPNSTDAEVRRLDYS